MTFTYNDVRATSKIEYNLNPTRDRLLIPSTLSGKRSKYSEAEGFENNTVKRPNRLVIRMYERKSWLNCAGWSSEYLVVQADKINEDANECDKAGVGFTAFVAQPGRCERVSGTCLKNQPLDYWRHDIVRMTSAINEAILILTCPLSFYFLPIILAPSYLSRKELRYQFYRYLSVTYSWFVV